VSTAESRGSRAARKAARLSTGKVKRKSIGKTPIPDFVEAGPRKGLGRYNTGIYRTPLDNPTVLGI
jgi:hypothetical protein